MYFVKFSMACSLRRITVAFTAGQILTLLSTWFLQDEKHVYTEHLSPVVDTDLSSRLMEVGGFAYNHVTEKWLVN